MENYKEKKPKQEKPIKKRRYDKLKESILKLFNKIEREIKFELEKEALGITRRYVLDLGKSELSLHDPLRLLEKVKPLVLKKFEENLITKQQLTLVCLMKKTNPATGETITNKSHFHSHQQRILKGSNFDEIFEKMKDDIIHNFEAYLDKGSQWQFHYGLKLILNINKIKVLNASSYIPLSKFLKNKNVIINLKNFDQKCLLWCVGINEILKTNPNLRNPGRITEILKKKVKKFNLDGMNFPCGFSDIDKFGKNNISINLFGYEEKEIFPLRISDKAGERVNILLIENDGNKHYCLIKNMSRLFSSQANKHNEKIYICDYCLQFFNCEKTLEDHLEYCKKFKCGKAVYPEKGETLKFKNYEKMHDIPFVIYADLESILKPVNNNIGDNTKQFQKHKPSGYGYLIKCFDDNVFKPKLKRYTKKSKDEDVSLKFVKSLEKSVRKIYEKFKFPKRILMREEDEKDFENAEKCYACGIKFEREVEKVKDHCHFTGKYRGAACCGCNSKMKKPKFIPVIFQNLQNYDSHLFIKMLGFTEGEINCIPKTEEKYISFSKDIVVDKFVNKENQEIVNVKRQLRFIDSFKFMASSLEKLAKNLDSDEMCILKRFFKDEKERKLLERKGVFPYDWFDNIEKLKEKRLPPIDKFYSKLNCENISEEDYQHAKNVWKKFNMENMRDYHDLYLKTDVLLLADVFENFRKVCKENYGLDPAWYYTSPGLAWDAMLKKTGVELELVSDPNMYLMIENGIRGGISTITKRYAKANNPYMGEKFDPNKETKYIPYLDANNLYGWAMSKPLPVRNFKWMDEKELENWENIPCILEVDLEYPEDLHHLHNEYPLAVERIKVGKREKLIPNLRDKEKYVLHCENLKLYQSLGLKVTKIHKGVKFQEEDFMNKYIDLNTKLRKNGKNDFEKDFFKLINNLVFGKTMENVRNRVDIQLCSKEEKALKLFSKTNFDRRTIFSENLIAIHMHKKKIMLNKPIYLGMSILDLSKTLMYDFHYNYFKKKYGENAKLLFTDTDSLMYEIKTKDFYKDISADVEKMFDTSNYPEKHPSGIKTGVNKKVVGMIKDECGGKQIVEFVGLRPKSYSYEVGGSKEKKCKGIKKNVIKKDITFQNYKDCLFKEKEETRKMNLIRHRNHDLYSESIEKIALSSKDDKRIVIENKIDTLAYGHYMEDMIKTYEDIFGSNLEMRMQSFWSAVFSVSQNMS